MNAAPRPLPGAGWALVRMLRPLLGRRAAPFTVVTPWITVRDDLRRCGPHIHPLHWPTFVAGIHVRQVDEPVVTRSTWTGSVVERIDAGPFGSVQCQLHIDYAQEVDRVITHYRLEASTEEVFVRNEGRVLAELHSVREGWTRMRVEKTLEFHPDAVQADLGWLAPAATRAYLTSVLVRFSRNYSAFVRRSQG